MTRTHMLERDCGEVVLSRQPVLHSDCVEKAGSGSTFSSPPDDPE